MSFMVFMYYKFICIVLLPIYTFKKKTKSYAFVEQITQLVDHDNVFKLTGDKTLIKTKIGIKT